MVGISSITEVGRPHIVCCKIENDVCKGEPTLELRAQFRAISRAAASGMSEGIGRRSYFLPENQPSTTVMRFSVSVPVLSEQMAEAPPMVSHAASTRTKLLSCNIYSAANIRGHNQVCGTILDRGTVGAQCENRVFMNPTFIIFFMENARLIVTASGRPSGTATTRMVTEKMKNCSGPDENLEIGKPLFWIIHLCAQQCESMT